VTGDRISTAVDVGQPDDDIVDAFTDWLEGDGEISDEDQAALDAFVAANPDVVRPTPEAKFDEHEPAVAAGARAGSPR